MQCIEARSLTKSYGNHTAVDHIKLDVEGGTAFGFLGSNGAGKSTTIKMLTTLIRPTSGTLNVLGMDALAEPLNVRRRIGVIQQQHAYEPTLSVERSLTKYGMMWDVPAEESRRRAEQILHDFDLVDIRRQRNEDLSVGQRRRVQVAREFMHQMDLLFLDEPTVGLDPAARRALLDYLREKVAAGLTIFYTTHVLSEADYLCDKIAIIKKGRILVCDTPTALKKRMGRAKIITISTNGTEETVGAALEGVDGCTIEGKRGASVIIRSRDPEQALSDVLIRLRNGGIRMRDVSAEAATLEEIFLETIKDATNTSIG